MKINTILSSLLVLSTLAFALFTPQPVAAQAAFDACDDARGNSVICNNRTEDEIESTAVNIINLGLWAVGLLSVVMIIVSGIFYVISVGDSARIKTAKNTLMYAVVGLIVALMSYAIVNFVISELL